MVTKELKYFLYLVKAYFVFFLIPIIITIFIGIEFSIGMEEIAQGSVFLLLFPLLILPVIGIMDYIGSLEQKEIFITFPISHWLAGFIRPIILGSVISVSFSIIVTIYINNQLLLSSFSSALLYISLASFFISLTKHSGLGLAMALFYLIFGLFTTGMGQGPLYLGQWYRPRPFTDPNDYILVQLIAVIVVNTLTVYCIKYRSKFHLFD